MSDDLAGGQQVHPYPCEFAEMLQLLPFESQQPLRGLLYTLLRLPDLVLRQTQCAVDGTQCLYAGIHSSGNRLGAPELPLEH